MTTVYQKESKRTGNDCMIEEGFYIIEIFGSYLAYHLTHYSGWMGDDYDADSDFCKTEKEARKKLKKWGLDEND